MWEDEDCSLSHAKGSDSLDLERHKMFRPSCRSSSPFSLTDLDMWDTKSRFTAQTSAWCDMATVSGTEFLSKVSTSTSGSTGGFRQNDPGLRKWQSLSHLALEGATRSFPPCPGAELRATRGESSFRQTEVVQCLQDAHERLNTQLDWLSTRNSQLSYNITTAKLLDMKNKLSEVMTALEQEKEAAELSQFEKSRQRGELREKVLQLEKDLQQMRSILDRGNSYQPTEKTPRSLSRSLPMSQEDFNRQERQKVDTELYKLREALREAEARAKTQEEERNQALQKLQASTEIQRRLLNQIEEMNQRLSHTRQNHSEVQEQLSEANNTISQACLEKAILSTQVLKLEDDIKELKAKVTGPLSDKDHLIQEKADLHQRAQVLELQLKRAQQGSEGCEVLVIQSHNNKQDQETVLMKEESKALREVNEKLTCELEMIKQKLKTSQSLLQEVTAERVINSKQITDLEAECTQLIREKEELLSKMNEDRHEELTEIKEKCCQLGESVEVLELEKLKLQNQCLSLEAEVLEKEEKLHLQEEEYRKQDAVRVQSIEELQVVATHWTEKWQKVALTLQSTQEELEKLKKNNSTEELQVESVHLASEIEKLKKEGQKDKEEIENLLQHKANVETVLTRAKRESDSLLRVELDACKQELELERSRSQALLHRYKDKGGEAVQTQDKQTETDLSESSLLWEPPSDSQSSQNKSPQVCIQSSEVQRLKQKLTEREKELREKEEALKSLEGLREMEKNEAQLKISALELKASEDGQDDGGQADVSTTNSLRAQLEESRRRVNRLQQEKTLAVQKIQTLRQLYLGKDEKPSVEGRKDKTVCPVILETDQQRRMVTEQLKSLFKEREGKEVGKVDNRSAAAQTGASTLQDWTPTSKIIRSAVDRRSWQQGSGLMPVFEEDEESSDWPGGEEGKPAEETHAKETFPNQSQQMSTMSAELSNLKAKKVNLLQATLRCKQPIQDRPPKAKKLSDKSSDVEGANLYHCSDETDLQQKRPPSLYPDGIFLAELVDICSPDEDEEGGKDK
ncbi:trichohyalin-like isoform X2 [Siniperca chuatsi]|uniref:trichohyalin-like isoform X2 n=1 Tax=Siniperca chuatsi TaxID=119488 RepID=UPI001CE0ABA7|nr:trichohyalin-like isoform X2 [Siniperca chuatsi]